MNKNIFICPVLSEWYCSTGRSLYHVAWFLFTISTNFPFYIVSVWFSKICFKQVCNLCHREDFNVRRFQKIDLIIKWPTSLHYLWTQKYSVPTACSFCHFCLNGCELSSGKASHYFKYASCLLFYWPFNWVKWITILDLNSET